jgi:excisionase family DNA binding protein
MLTDNRRELLDEELLNNRKEFLAVPDLQELSGESEATWRKRLGRREIPFTKFGANVRVRRSDFEGWVAARTVRAEVI